MGKSAAGWQDGDGIAPVVGKIACASVLALLAACAAPSPTMAELTGDGLDGDSHALTAPATRDAYPTPAGGDNIDYGSFSKEVNDATGFIGLMLKTYTMDPLVRPISTARSLGFLIKNTVADFARQSYISMFKMPAVTNAPLAALADGPGMDLEEWENELDRLTGASSSRGTLEFLIDGDEYFNRLVEAVETADESVHIRTYIFDNDDFAVQVADLLKRRSGEIDVRVQMDGFGTYTGGMAMPSTMPESFTPPPSIADYLRNDSQVDVRTLTNPWFTGDHSKVTIVDQSTAFLGGMNIGREYRFDWHDLMVKIDGPVVDELVRDADNTWNKSGFLGDLAGLFAGPSLEKPTVAEDGYPIRVLYTRAQHSQIYETQLAAIRRAKDYVYIENPYFSDDSILYELIAARRRGVDVRFVIAEKGDAALMDMSNAKTINTMLHNGIRVYLYPKMTHVKAMMVDDWIMVGSANLDKLSLRVNNEINIATSHPESVDELKRRLFFADFEYSTELEGALPTGVGHHLAEAIADVFL
jgi:cardiolipin synthase